MPFRENHVVFEDEPYIVDETRLALNVYVPKTKNLAKKPVMVWIHGGHMQFGCGEQEDPTVLGNLFNVNPSENTVICRINPSGRRCSEFALSFLRAIVNS